MWKGLGTVLLGLAANLPESAVIDLLTSCHE